MEKLKYAQDLIKASTSVMCGFNMFINGHPPLTFGQGYSDAYARMQGYDLAENMAKNGEIAFTHGFRCNCGGFPFLYGGFWVCNSCGGKNVDKVWWNIKVEKDGNAYCCHGLDFVNLQESDNYAFGDTYKEAISNYEELMLNRSVSSACC